ncbi:MAG: lipoate--protein ligase family protein [Candidatus Omnitrophica bacterium]|nr:lipoate--protein ligase family protein [Candidatus Omnitrophota bacterium]
MARDEQLAQQVRARFLPATLRIYQWDRPAISLGRRQAIGDLLSAETVISSPKGTRNLVFKNEISRRFAARDDIADLPLVHRPTGGGAVLHRLDELTYALAIPSSSLPSDVRLNRIPGILHQEIREELVRRGLISSENLEVTCGDSDGPFTLCFDAPVCGDLLYRGKKVAGSALRAWRDGLLIQGSIQGLPVPYDQLKEALIASVESWLRLEEAAPFLSSGSWAAAKSGAETGI